MGESGRAHCRGCGHGFGFNTGSGFKVVGIHCEDCGHREQFIRSDDPPQEDRSDPGCFGHCSRCDGRLTYAARPRCPKCRSTELDFASDRLWD